MSLWYAERAAMPPFLGSTIAGPNPLLNGTGHAFRLRDADRELERVTQADECRGCGLIMVHSHRQGLQEFRLHARMLTLARVQSEFL